VTAGDILITQVETDSEAFVAGIDVATGINRWKIDRARHADWTSPMLQEGRDGKPVVILQSSSGVTAIDPATGSTAWNWVSATSTIPSGAVRGQNLYVISGGITALQPDPAGQSPHELWRSNLLRANISSPVLWDDGIFTVNDAGVLTRGKLADGSRAWQLRLKGPFTASPVADAHHLYLVNEAGLLQVVDPAKPEGEVVSELDLGETILATPSIAGRALYVRSDAHLWKIGK